MQHSPGPNPDDDQQLAADFVRRDAGALGRAYAAYGGLLYAVARRILGDGGDAEDCVHDTLLRIWARADCFRPQRGALRSFLLVSVRNEALTRKRSAARHLRIEERAARDAQSSYEFDVSEPRDRSRLKAALAGLPPEQRTALELAYFGELTHVQIAERLGLPLGTAKSRIALALRKLHAALGEEAGAR